VVTAGESKRLAHFLQNALAENAVCDWNEEVLTLSDQKKLLLTFL
jgi:hypothetical protein